MASRLPGVAPVKTNLPVWGPGQFPLAHEHTKGGRRLKRLKAGCTLPLAKHVPVLTAGGLDYAEQCVVAAGDVEDQPAVGLEFALIKSQRLASQKMGRDGIAAKCVDQNDVVRVVRALAICSRASPVT